MQVKGRVSDQAYRKGLSQILVQVHYQVRGQVLVQVFCLALRSIPHMLENREDRDGTD
jgi:hypothetical protein